MKRFYQKERKFLFLLCAFLLILGLLVSVFYDRFLITGAAHYKFDECEDSDGGLDYERPGSVNLLSDGFVKETFTDSCLKGTNKLIEQYCKRIPLLLRTNYKALSKTYSCLKEQVCQEGACVSKLPIPIEKCRVIDKPGYYYLTDNISDVRDERCFYISSDNVIIDGEGYSINGINLENSMAITTGSENIYKKIRIQNITIKNFHVGIYFLSEKEVYGGNSITNSKIVSNKEGITLVGGDHFEIINVNVSNNELGIAGFGASHILIKNVSANNESGLGILLFGGSFNNIIQSEANNIKADPESGGGIGIIIASNFSNITKTTMHDSKIGLISFGDNFLIDNVSVQSNTDTGMIIMGNNTKILNSKITRNGIGVQFGVSDDKEAFIVGGLTVNNNFVCNNDATDFACSADTDNLASKNLFKNHIGCKWLEKSKLPCPPSKLKKFKPIQIKDRKSLNEIESAARNLINSFKN